MCHSDQPDGATIWSALKPVSEGTGEVRAITPVEHHSGLFLLPGDIRLAEFEAELSTFWGECFQRKAKGLRGTTALSQLVDSVAASLKVDFVFYDSGPNIGALNRVILLDCDYFIIPAAADLFSLRAIKTLGHTLAEWVSDWNTIAALMPDDLYKLPGAPKLLGYIPQRFKVYAGRPAANYAQIFPRIERTVQEDVLAVVRKVDTGLGRAAKAPLRLGEVQEFGSLANASQQWGIPMAEFGVGMNAAAETFTSIAQRILDKIASAQ